jgi:alpha-glucosidase
VEDVKDPVGRREWPRNKGRDGERTPMQWNSGANAGFSEAKPWLPVPPSYTSHNVALEEKAANSVLAFYQQLLKLRRENPALLEGNYVALNTNDPNVLAFLREVGGRAVLVALNMSGSPQKPKFSLPQYQPRITSLLESGASGSTSGIALEPFGVFIGGLVANRDSASVR